MLTSTIVEIKKAMDLKEKEDNIHHEAPRRHDQRFTTRKQGLDRDPLPDLPQSHPGPWEVASRMHSVLHKGIQSLRQKRCEVVPASAGFTRRAKVGAWADLVDKTKCHNSGFIMATFLHLNEVQYRESNRQLQEAIHIVPCKTLAAHPQRLLSGLTCFSMHWLVFHNGVMEEI